MKKKLYIFLGTVLFVSFMLALVALMLPKGEGPTPNLITPPTATLTPAPQTTTYPVDSFHLLNVMPTKDAVQPYLPSQKITFVFNLPITPSLLKYEINPLTQVDVIQGPNLTTLFVIPKTFWTIGETTITILQTTRSTDGTAIFAPFTHKIKTDFPKEPEGVFNVE